MFEFETYCFENSQQCAKYMFKQRIIHQHIHYTVKTNEKNVTDSNIYGLSLAFITARIYHDIVSISSQHVFLSMYFVTSL